MIHFYLKLVGLLLLATPLLAAVPTQEGFLGEIPWWTWLVVLAVLLLFLFVLIVSFDWSGAPESDAAEDEG